MEYLWTQYVQTTEFQWFTSYWYLTESYIKYYQDHPIVSSLIIWEHAKKIQVFPTEFKIHHF